MSIPEITNKILQKRLAPIRNKEPRSSIASHVYRNPKKFKRIRPGVYGLNTRVKTSHPAQNSRHGTFSYHDTLGSHQGFSYSYWEDLKSVTEGSYIYGGMKPTTLFVFCEKNKKIFNMAVKQIDSEKKPGVYILMNLNDNTAYVGETKCAYKRIINKHWANKKFTHIAILFEEIFSDMNVRKNLENHLIKFAKSREWESTNSSADLPDIDKRDKQSYDALVKRTDVIISKVNGFVVRGRKLSGGKTGGTRKRTRKPPSKKWSVALAKANPEVRARVIKLTKMIQDRFNVTTVKKSWLYFDDGGGSSKRTFAALSVGKSVADLIFLAPHDSALPDGTRRLKRFVLAYNAECRLRLSDENLDLLVELARKSREYRHILESRG